MAQLHLDRTDAFTAAECDAILRLAAASAVEPATVWSGAGDHVDRATRDAERCYWPRSAASAWIYARLDALFADAAVRLGVEADPVFEDIQYVRYPEGGHFQVWHSDAGQDRYHERQISVSVELSDPADFAGGRLEIASAPASHERLPRGGARLFLSRAIHRVTPVTAGTRHALVAWTGKRPVAEPDVAS